jgi:hypothetical protein
MVRLSNGSRAEGRYCGEMSVSGAKLFAAPDAASMDGEVTNPVEQITASNPKS